MTRPIQQVDPAKPDQKINYQLNLYISLMSQDNLFDGISPVYHLINKKKDI